MERTLDPARLGDHLDRLYRAAWALSGSREDAEDLVQQTYARVLARPRLLRNEDDLGYLLRALRNTFLTQKRTESRRLRPAHCPTSSTPSPTRTRAIRTPHSKPASSTPRSPHSRTTSAMSSSP
jgi:DNA-directed RNA polymerase specialized sigma24 family protein